MVKFSNKARGQPTKRRKLKTKFKIERKVKQYKKKVKKQAKKMKTTGIKHKRNPQKDVLPNMFPLKNQMLQQFKKSLPQQPQAPINIISAADFGLVTMENKPVYFPKGRDYLTKKYITNLTALLKKCKVVLHALDSRNPQICIDQAFLNECASNSTKVVFVVMKSDTVNQKKLAQDLEKLRKDYKHVVKFSHQSKHKHELIPDLFKAINQAKLQNGLGQSNNVSISIVGKAKTGKHTLASILCKHAGKYQDLPSELFELNLTNGVKIIDGPYQIQDSTNFPLFKVPTEIGQQESVSAQEETIIKHLFFGGLPYYKASILNRNQILQNYLIQDYISIEDLCKKVGKSLKIFGKGGMIDVPKVRCKILTQWFTGKLNKFINPMK